MPWAWGNGHQENSAVPKVYLNYIYINKEFDVNSLDVDFAPLTIAGLEDGSNVPHDTLRLMKPIAEAGYVYVYLSNEEEPGVSKEVYFDDFKAEHKKSQVFAKRNYHTQKPSED
ncbi:MAG TPA: hypothetical protein VFE50_03595 [Cyclobacteriaceae bacterium]|nr:hypothetical protein [Cyclobacteriaceae bacterium]